MEQGLSRKLGVGYGTFLASVASQQPCKYLLGDTDRIQCRTVIICLACLDLQGEDRSEKGVWIRRKSGLYPLSAITQQTLDQQATLTHPSLRSQQLTSIAWCR